MALSPEHTKRLQERGLDPILCARLGVHSMGKAIAFDYLANGKLHNTKIRHGKGDMPWEHGGRPLILWNVDCLVGSPVPDEEVIITEGEPDAITFLQAGFSRVVSVPNGAQSGASDAEKIQQGFEYLFRGKELLPGLERIGRFVIATDGDAKGQQCRDALAVRLGDERCRWVVYPAGCKDANDVLQKHGLEAVVQLVVGAKPMWIDEVCRMSDVPDVGTEPRYRIGIPELDSHGFRITLPALWVLLGPYGSGKSVLLRQVLCQLWRHHGWPAALTSFEERIKPRYQRDFRRNLIGRQTTPDQPWTDEEIAAADEEIERGFVFMQRAKRKVFDTEAFLDRAEFAMRVYGVKVIAVDPFNELRLNVPGNGSRTDYIGDFMMEFKDLCDDYQALGIIAAHVSKASAEKRLSKGQILTLNDGEDSRHWGGKADMGWCIWREIDGPTWLHVDKVKDHETMGRPTLARLELDRALNQFTVRGIGYDLLKKE
jgi:twinkle protein